MLTLFTTSLSQTLTCGDVQKIYKDATCCSQQPSSDTCYEIYSPPPKQQWDLVLLNKDVADAAISKMRTNPPKGAAGFVSTDSTAVSGLVLNVNATYGEWCSHMTSINPSSVTARGCQHELFTAGALLGAGGQGLFAASPVYRSTDKDGNVLDIASTHVRRFAAMDRARTVVSAAIGTPVLYEHAAFQFSSLPPPADFEDIPAAEFSIRKYVAAALLLELMYKARDIPGLSYTLHTPIEDVLGTDVFSADQGAFVMGIEPTTDADVELISLHNREGGNAFTFGFSQEIIANTGAFFVTPPTSTSGPQFAVMGPGGTEVQTITFNSTLMSGSEVSLTISKTSLTRYQKTTIADALTERTGIVLSVLNNLQTESFVGEDPDPEVSTHSIGGQLAGSVQQLLYQNAFAAKGRLGVPGGAPTYGYGITFVLRMIRHIYSRSKYYREHGTLQSFDATVHDTVDLPAIFDEKIFQPLNMTSSGLTNPAFKAAHPKMMAHTTSWPDASETGAQMDMNSKFVTIDLLSMLPVLAPDYLLSTAKDMIKFEFAMNNNGVSLGGTQVFAPGVMNLMLRRATGSVDWHTARTAIVDWHDPEDIQTKFSYAASLLPGTIYLTAPGAYVGDKYDSTFPMDPLSWSGFSTGYRIKVGYGHQIAFEMTDIGLYWFFEKGHHDFVHTSFRKTGDGDIHVNDDSQLEIEDITRQIMPNSVLHPQITN